MKKLLLLVLSMGALTATFAQRFDGSNEHQNNGYRTNESYNVPASYPPANTHGGGYDRRYNERDGGTYSYGNRYDNRYNNGYDRRMERRMKRRHEPNPYPVRQRNIFEIRIGGRRGH